MPNQDGTADLGARLRKLLGKLDSLVRSAKGAARDASVANANLEALVAHQAQAGGLTDALEDPDLHGAIASELDKIEEDLGAYEEQAFFRRPPALAKLSVGPVANQTSHLRQQIVWRLGSVDLDHPQSWCRCESGETLRDLAGHLKNLESYTWGELPALSDSNHEWEDVSAWEGPSQARVRELNLDDQSGWYQLHLTGRGRLFGFRMENVFNVVWWDRDHEVYEPKKLRKSQKK